MYKKKKSKKFEHNFPEYTGEEDGGTSKQGVKYEVSLFAEGKRFSISIPASEKGVPETWMEMTSDFYFLLKGSGFLFNENDKKNWSELINSRMDIGEIN